MKGHRPSNPPATEQTGRRPAEGHQRWVPVVAQYVSIFAIAVSGLFTLYKYLDEQAVQQARTANAQRVEAQKPFLQKQLALFFETAEIGNKLIEWDIDPKGDEWKKVTKRSLGERAIITCVQTAMFRLA